jgi:hypothetical protein
MTGLFTHQHQVRRSGSLTRHDLGCRAIKRAPTAFRLGVAQLFQRVARRLFCAILDHLSCFGCSPKRILTKVKATQPIRPVRPSPVFIVRKIDRIVGGRFQVIGQLRLVDQVAPASPSEARGSSRVLQNRRDRGDAMRRGRFILTQCSGDREKPVVDHVGLNVF